MSYPADYAVRKQIRYALTHEKVITFRRISSHEAAETGVR